MNIDNDLKENTVRSSETSPIDKECEENKKNKDEKLK